MIGIKMRNPQDIKIGEYTLKEILERHKHWLDEDCEEWKDMRANLDGADLSYANLKGVNLHGADLHDVNLYAAYLYSAILINVNLRGAELEGAILRNANLYGTDLSNANLHDASLENANLRGTNLSNTNLRGTNLCDANLYGTNLCGADLSNANLRDANLCDADLDSANLYNVNLYGANLRDADLFGVDLSNVDLRNANLYDIILSGANGNLIEFRRGKILAENLIGYKKCKEGVIVTLEIPRGAIVFSINGNKCRTNKAKVIDIKGANRAYSTYQYMSYYIGDEFTVYNFNCEYNVQCAEGIHFYMSKVDAENADL